ncbi:pyruvate dehydrogenase kinase [Drepanopeziza brunnea f. sp. 'multigermtubi' MB_m1]|uniref:Protein-serine/threonine kinase n=1 Tax=Marssonina brunnea f. sp. multigermtubi (strain MB_m1) TaxID=1072389 RepID=K1X8M6_MARBU|nr:pyruvate dehydrogenase kinase [Drepanopeziza brunnea f. sp. 'multigermtubi' MB_m1]EKD17048.1 pyruvate dehydrogenase kinase [Drepanopeziza brunnea f. sp. 'multigermtubi' MB_m1]
MSWKKSERLMDTIKHYSGFPATGVSLRQMVQFGEKPSTGTLFRASQFLSEELPIRLAHRVQELGDLPDGLNDMPSIKKVQDWYAQSFEEITQLPRPNLAKDVRDRLMKPQKQSGRPSKVLAEATQNPSVERGQYNSSSWQQNGYRNGNGEQKMVATRRYFATVEDSTDWPPELQDYNQRFSQTLNTIKRRHDGVVTTVAQGILEYKRKRQRMQIDNNIQSFLDRFYMSRIGIRMLIGQHIALTDQSHNRDPTYVGIICTKTNVHDLAQEAIENARFVCEDHYGLFDAPKVQLVCPPHLNFMYVPGHLSHMLFETLKNSLRAVVETHGQDKDEFPVTKVVVAEGKEDITIKISDEGGGIPRSAIPLVWTYMYTTVDTTPNLDPDFDKNDFKAPMAGFGYGLPISRLYARYFGGDLKLISMEGYGTDKQMSLRLRNRREEVTERKQVGDAESMINEGRSAPGHYGLFRGEGGEV